ncbi:hypothetical protein DICVIV_08716 [Dictyocaulus viviparus]|uniref:Poly(A) RNA polymerase mitochondrial-like central palm domain-containing protein n=1 Tax=Dictyocaulus viviparus TaxID=29172 RepID=A0A0D8XS87_DICVI|nr:hypothetical protein DICVIV_08716 [Dictyocaulus viviparus]
MVATFKVNFYLKRAICSSRSSSTLHEINYKFSVDFILKHQTRLIRWDFELLKAQRQRAQSLYNNILNIGGYLTKLRSALSTKEKLVVPIGSCVNGLRNRNSDLDIVLVTSHQEAKQSAFNSRFRNDIHFRRTQMDIIANILKKKKLADVNSIQQLILSNVPILKFRSCDGINVDLQFNNIPSIRSTAFVKTCVEFSAVVPITIHWINSFFEVVKLKDSRHGLFSSYHLNMLALHFLQAAPLSLLPDMISFYPHLLPTVPWQNVADFLTTENSKEYAVDYTSLLHHISAAEVIVRMVDYYSQLDLFNFAINTTGKCYPRETEDERSTFIQLDDPYFADYSPASSRCNVQNSSYIVQQTFSALKSELECGNLQKLFRIYPF